MHQLCRCKPHGSNPLMPTLLEHVPMLKGGLQPSSKSHREQSLPQECHDVFGGMGGGRNKTRLTSPGGSNGLSQLHFCRCSALKAEASWLSCKSYLSPWHLFTPKVWRKCRISYTVFAHWKQGQQCWVTKRGNKLAEQKCANRRKQTLIWVSVAQLLRLVVANTLCQETLCRP